MKIGVLGTGEAGQRYGGKLIQLGHDVMMGARSSENEKVLGFAARTGGKAGKFADAALHGDIVFNCLRGDVALDVLTAVSGVLEGKILVDMSNPLDFSKGAPPTLSISNTDSLGEVIQRGLPRTRVVKTLNTMNSAVGIDPAIVPGPHAVFVSGNDKPAKGKIMDLLRSLGWVSIIDLGDITSARATEQMLPLWTRLYSVFGTGEFNFAVLRK